MSLVTVFTPTYNRAKLLPRLYESLCKQTCLDFEWLIVDDGSTDNTEEIINKKLEIRKSKFKVRYFKKENGGKHTAINFGVRKAQGELFLILDSDDELPKDSIENILEEYNRIEDETTIAGVCGYMSHRNGGIIGKPIFDCIVNSLDLRYKLGVKGDMCEVFRTDVLKEYPFPEIEGERFCPEALIWNRIAQKYKLKVFPKVIYYRDYLEGGLTDNIVKIRMNSPIASMMTYQEMTGYDVPLIVKVKSAINYWRFRFCYQKRMDSNICVPVLRKVWNVFSPIAFLMHLRDVIMVRQ